MRSATTLPGECGSLALCSPMTASVPAMLEALTREDLRSLARARALLEAPGLTARLADMVGRPLEKGFSMLPPDWSKTVHHAVQVSLMRAMDLAVNTLGSKTPARSSDLLHKALVGVSGGVGGAFGLLALPIELPVSTALMLRSIAEIARDEGHDVRNVHTQLDCLHVFALGGPSASDDATESAYWGVRAALSKSLGDAVAYFTEKGAVEKWAPAAVRLVSAIAARFGVVVSEQAAAKAIPLLGAATGSAINVLFLNHFQQMARGHFIVRRLEAKYGITLVMQAYQSLPASRPARP